MSQSYSCDICKTKPDQLSHHKSHLKTQKHKNQRTIFTLQLQSMDIETLEQQYKSNNIQEIVSQIETKSVNLKEELLASMNYTITNSDSLKEHIHSIHNYLRNHGGGYGLGALKIFNIFYGLKKLEEHGLNEMIGLIEKFWFSSLLKMSNEKTDEEFHHHIVNGLLNELYDKPLLKDFLFYEIPKNIKSDVFRYLINQINDITRIEIETNVLLAGNVYEYFVGRDESAISELGAYFTNRLIVDFTIKKVNPKLDSDGNVPSMIDMFGGSGGFTTGYVNYMKEHFPNIDWKTNVHNISHFDINEDVLKAAALEILCLTKQLPNMKNIAYRNSFKAEFPNKYKYILTNPPYGGDTFNKSQTQKKRDELKKHILSSPELKKKYSEQLQFIIGEERKDTKANDKNNVSVETCSTLINDYAKTHDLNGNDKESCSLILFMATLDKGGTCAAVLKEGVMFNAKYKKLRLCLIENFNVREVISIPRDQFENTKTKTSLVIFDNTEEKTSKIKFSKLDVMKFTENKFEEDIYGYLSLTEMKDDIIGCQEVDMSTATIQDVRKNAIYSLNSDEYNQTEIVCGNEYNLIKIKDLGEFKPKSKRKASFGTQNGQFNFYTSSNKIQKCDVADYNEECLIIGDGGVANIKLDSNFSCSDHNHIIKTEYNHYIYYLLSGNIELLANGFTGSVLQNLSKSYLMKLTIPIPKNPEKIQQWVDKISQPYNKKFEKQNRIKIMEKTIQSLIQSICANEEDYEDVNFDDVLDYMKKKNKYKASDGKINGLFRFYTSSQDKVLFRDDYEFENIHILIGRGGVASLHLTSKFSVSHDDVYVLSSKIPEVDITYIYHYIKLNFELIEQTFKGSTLKHSSKTALSNIKIKIPKNKQLIKNMKPLFQNIERHKQSVKDADKLYKKYIHELSNEAFPNSNPTGGTH